MVHENVRTPEIIHVPEVAKMLGIKEDTLWQHVRKGTAPHSAKIMGRRVFRKQDVIDWINSRFS